MGGDKKGCIVQFVIRPASAQKSQNQKKYYLLEEKGVEIDEPIKWTAKMKRSLAQAKNGEVYKRNLEDVLNV